MFLVGPARGSVDCPAYWLPGRARRRSPMDCDQSILIAGFSTPRPTRCSPLWPVLNRFAVPTHPAATLPLPPPSGRCCWFLDEHEWPPGCDAGTSPVAPELIFAVSFPLFKTFAMPRKATLPAAAVNVLDRSSHGRFSRDLTWPLLGDH